METRQAIYSFLLDREASNRSPETIDWYRRKLKPFAERFPMVGEEYNHGVVHKSETSNLV